MAKRGRPPIDYARLDAWEREWNEGFRLLRDGVRVPGVGEEVMFPPPSPKEAEARLKKLKRMTPKQYVGPWARGIPTRVAEAHRTAKAVWLERLLKPRKILEQAKQKKIWDALVCARTVSAVKKACREWDRLPAADTREGVIPLSTYLIAYAKEFLALKRDKRFPRSIYADDSRLEYLARAMAGVLEEVSPKTAVERLRNLKHTVGGPLWNKRMGWCGCWRCDLKRVQQVLQKEKSK